VALDRDGRTDRARAEVGVVLSLDPLLRRLDSEEYVFVPAADVHFYRTLANLERGAIAEARFALRAYLAELGDGPYARHARVRLAEAETRVDPRELEVDGGIAPPDARALAAALSPAVRALEDCLPASHVMKVVLVATAGGIRSQPSHPAAACFDRVLGQAGRLALRGRGGRIQFSLPLAGRRVAAVQP